MKNKTILLVIGILIMSNGFLWHQSSINEKEINRLNGVISIYYNPINDSKLFMKDINGINVYNDIEDFGRIQALIDKYGLNNNTYPYLDIIYYNNSIECSGAYEDEPSYIELYRCDENITVRDNLNVSEEFIFLHELGHYVWDHNSSLEQYWADKYARERFTLPKQEESK